MAFFLEDDNEQAFQAALSFLDSFEPATGSSSQQKQADVPSQQPARPSNKRCLSNADKARRRTEINERKRWLRKTGAYGDPNRARNAQVKEISFLREQFEKLQDDLQVLQKKRREAAQKEANARVLALQIPSLWQKLADRQRQCREEAERTNIHLKLAVDHH